MHPLCQSDKNAVLIDFSSWMLLLPHRQGIPKGVVCNAWRHHHGVAAAADALPNIYAPMPMIQIMLGYRMTHSIPPFPSYDAISCLRGLVLPSNAAVQLFGEPMPAVLDYRHRQEGGVGPLWPNAFISFPQSYRHVNSAIYLSNAWPV